MNSMCFPSDSLARELLAEVQNAWSCDENGTVSTHHNTHHQGKDKALDVVAPKEENGQQHHEGRQ